MAMGIDNLDDYYWLAALILKGRTRTKRPDECIFPWKDVGDSHWPSLVVETGKTQSLSRLAQDARWWLTECEIKVKFVVLIDVEEAKGK
ncbi:hypothetical protein V8E54_001482 [Elaphomyces granulatus]